MNGKGRFGKTVIAPPGQPRVVKSIECGFSTSASEAPSLTVQGFRSAVLVALWRRRGYMSVNISHKR
jgi:hypothetical protein